MNQYLHHGENTDKTKERIAIVSGLRLPLQSNLRHMQEFQPSI